MRTMIITLCKLQSTRRIQACLLAPLLIEQLKFGQSQIKRQMLIIPLLDIKLESIALISVVVLTDLT